MMTEKKIKIRNRIAHFFSHHPWLKVIALILAVMTWFYVSGEISR